MKSTLLIILILSFSVACTNEGTNYAILSFDPATTASFANLKPAQLTPSELEKVNQLLSKCASEYNDGLRFDSELTETELPNYLIMDIAEYKRQYVPATNEDGDKIVWVNCFCSVSESWDWRANILGTEDGGNCYFQLTINLTQGTCEKIMVNGYA